MNKEIKFMKISPIFLWISGILCFLSILSISFFGFKFGIDFVGGTVLELKFDNSVEQVFVKDHIRSIDDKANISKTNVDTYIITTHELNKESEAIFTSNIEQKIGSFQIVKKETIGSVISNSLKTKAIWAIGLALTFILVYIAIAFSDSSERINSWKFSFSAIITLVHDILIICGLFSFLGYFMGVEIDLLFVTGILTLLGFSIHDTIVVFDRIREMLNNNKLKILDVADKGLNQTLGRSVYTSLTTFVMIFPLLLFSSDVFWFIFTLVIGILIGSYSSIFIAVPVLVKWNEFSKNKK